MPTFQLAGGAGFAGPAAVLEEGRIQAPPPRETGCPGQQSTEAASWALRLSIQRAWAGLPLPVDSGHCDNVLVKPRAQKGMTLPPSDIF